MSELRSKVKLRLGGVILSFPRLYEPDPESDKWGATFVLPPDYPEEDFGSERFPFHGLKTIREAFQEVGLKRFGKKFATGVANGTIRPGLRSDVEEKGYPEGSHFINARTKISPPQVVANAIDPATQKLKEISEQEAMQTGGPYEMYPGVIVNATVEVYAYEMPKGKGVTSGLGNVQRVKEGTRLGSRRAATDDFDDSLAETPESAVEEFLS